MATPTETAELFFRYSNSKSEASRSRDMSDADKHFYLAGSIGDLGIGLGHLAVGLRATYLLLERVERKLDQQRR
jgi:hypothetical protein